MISHRENRPGEKRPAPFDLLQWLSPPAATAFAQAAQIRRHADGQAIYVQGDDGDEMFRLVSGSVRLSVRRSDGREILYLLFEPGDCFGDSSMIDGEPRPQSAEAQGPVEVQVLKRATFQRLRAIHPEIEDALLRLFSRQMRLLIGFVADAHLDTLPSRVASRILAAADSFGIRTGEGIRLNIPFSQSELALMVGASRQSVNKALQAMQAEGLVTIEYGTLVIHDLGGLQALISD